MTRLKNIIRSPFVFLSVIAVAMFALFGNIGLLFVGMAAAGMAVGPTATSDPGIIRQWEKMSIDAYWLALWKTMLSDPMYTGTRRGKRGIEQREDVYGPPIKEYYNLRQNPGTTHVDTIHVPPFDTDEQVLGLAGTTENGFIRVKGQNRKNHAIQANRKNITFALQQYFFSIDEEELEMSEQEIGGDIEAVLIKNLTTVDAQYKDAERILTAYMGFSPHLYQRDAVARDVADGANVVGNADLGIETPYYPPHVLAWTNQNTASDPDYQMVLAENDDYASNWTGKVHETLGQIDDTAPPSRKMLDSIILYATTLRIVPVRYRVEGTYKPMYILMLSPESMNMLYDDADLEKRLGDAYNGKGLDHPLMKNEAITYRNLVIMEQEKLSQDIYSAYYNWAGETYDYGSTADGGDDANPSLSSGPDAERMTFAKDTSVGTGKDARFAINPHVRRFRTQDDGNITSADQEQAAGLAFGEEGGNHIDLGVLLGASALGAVPGPVFPMTRLKEDDHGRIVGIGKPNMGGCRRIDFPTTAGRSHPSGKLSQGMMLIGMWNGTT